MVRRTRKQDRHISLVVFVSHSSSGILELSCVTEGNDEVGGAGIRRSSPTAYSVCICRAATRRCHTFDLRSCATLRGKGFQEKLAGLGYQILKPGFHLSPTYFRKGRCTTVIVTTSPRALKTAKTASIDHYPLVISYLSHIAPKLLTLHTSADTTPSPRHLIDSRHHHVRT